MATQGFQQVQKQTQSMVLAPQLRQSLKILQVHSMELRSVIMDELQVNPTLEEMPYEDISLNSDQTSPSEPQETQTSGELDTEKAPTKAEDITPSEDPGYDSAEKLDFGEDFSNLEKMGSDWADTVSDHAGEQPFTSEDAEKRQHFFDSLTGSISLQEHLMDQARLQSEDSDTITALEYIIGSLDESGFLTSKASDLSLIANMPLKSVQSAITLLQSLEPAGIGAEDVQHCLLIQLRQKGMAQSLASRIIQKEWQRLLRRRIPEMSRNLSVSPVEIQSALEIIAKLDPAPARKFAEDANQVIEPDVTVEQDDEGEWIIILNNDYIPKLRISNDYKRILASGQLRGKDREYLQEKFRSSRFLMNAIEQRQQTIERITRQILIFQRDFFDNGRQYLRPLTMSQVAEVVGVHETTVSRAIANKYIRTPLGVFEMKFFFTPGYTNKDGSSVSNQSIKDRISQIIEEEPSSKPYSDQKIVEILGKEGVKIARRTVAKYREELGILPTNLRRQYA